MIFADTSTLSLANPGGSKPVEIKIPLWWADGTAVSIVGTSANVAGQQYLMDGSNGVTPGIGSADSIFTLNSKWPANTKYAFECAIYAINASYPVYAEIWDMTSNSAVASSQVTTTSLYATVLRSSQFTLTPGHAYGVTIWTSNSGSATVYLIDASLIIFP